MMGEVIKLGSERAKREVAGDRAYHLGTKLDKLLADYSDLHQAVLIDEVASRLVMIERGIFGRR
jgi:hypothetical protein